MTNENKHFHIKRETLEQLAQKQLEEIEEEMAVSEAAPSRQDDPGVPQNKTTTADLFSGIPEEQ